MAPAKMSFDPQAARCFACGKQGHVAAACPNPSKKTACHPLRRRRPQGAVLPERQRDEGGAATGGL